MTSKQIKSLLEKQLREMEKHEGGTISGGKTPKWLKSVGHALGTVAKKSVPVLEKIGAKVADKLVEKGVNYALGGKKDERKKRGLIVKKIMEEKGISLPEASKYVKDHNLYKK